MLLNLKNLEKIASKIRSALPNESSYLKEEVKNNARPIISAMLKKMDFVTQEEFDVQKAVLEKTRGKLEELERKIASIENKEC